MFRLNLTDLGRKIFGPVSLAGLLHGCFLAGAMGEDGVEFNELAGLHFNDVFLIITCYISEFYLNHAR